MLTQAWYVVKELSVVLLITLLAVAFDRGVVWEDDPEEEGWDPMAPRP